MWSISMPPEQLFLLWSRPFHHLLSQLIFNSRPVYPPFPLHLQYCHIRWVFTRPGREFIPKRRLWSNFKPALNAILLYQNQKLSRQRFTVFTTIYSGCFSFSKPCQLSTEHRHQTESRVQISGPPKPAPEPKVATNVDTPMDLTQTPIPMDLSHKPEKKAAKPRPDRVTDPAIQELKCVSGGNYKYSISKQSFFKVRCPFCYRIESAQNSERKEVDCMVRAEYWRRHMTEVHNK